MLKRIAYVVIWLLTIYTAVIYDSVSLIFLAGVELLPLLLLLILLVQRPLLHLSFSRDRYFLEPEQSSGLELRIRNQSILPLRRLSVRLKFENLTTGETYSRCMERSVHTKEQMILAPSEGLGYGVWQVSCRKIRMYDFLLFSYIRKWKRFYSRIICLPRCHEIKKIVCASGAGNDREPKSYVPETVGNDGTSIREIREYRPGDSLHAIHWKLSAKKEELLVKESGQPQGFRVLFGLNLTRLDAAALELIFSLLLGLVKRQGEVRFLFQPPKEAEPMQLFVNSQEEAALAMETVMERHTIAFHEQPGGVAGEPQLWLSDGLILTKDGRVVREFYGEDLRAHLADLELIL